MGHAVSKSIFVEYYNTFGVGYVQLVCFNDESFPKIRLPITVVKMNPMKPKEDTTIKTVLFRPHSA